MHRCTIFGAAKPLASRFQFSTPGSGKTSRQSGARGARGQPANPNFCTVPFTPTKAQPDHQKHFCLPCCCLLVVNCCRAGGSEKVGTSFRYVQNPVAIRRTRGKAANQSQLPSPEYQHRETPSADARSMPRPSLPRICADVLRCSVSI